MDGRVVDKAAVEEAQGAYNESGAIPYHLRSPELIARFFDGLELVEPGVVPFTHWRPDPDGGPTAEVDGYCGVAQTIAAPESGGSWSAPPDSRPETTRMKFLRPVWTETNPLLPDRDRVAAAAKTSPGWWCSR